MFCACNDFCTVLSRTVLITFTLQMCFCISAHLYLIMSRHCWIQFIRSSRLFVWTPKELFVVAIFGWRTFSTSEYCNTEIIICDWKECLCCSFWTSSSMNADLNVFNTCFTWPVSVEHDQRVFCCRPYQWMTAFTHGQLQNVLLTLHGHSPCETVAIDITESLSFRKKIAWVFESRSQFYYV